MAFDGPRGSRTRLFGALAIVAALVIAGLFIPRLLASPAPGASTPHSVWVIVMENRADTSIIHSKSAPYLNSLIRQYGLAGDLWPWYGLGNNPNPTLEKTASPCILHRDAAL